MHFSDPTVPLHLTDSRGQTEQVLKSAHQLVFLGAVAKLTAISLVGIVPAVVVPVAGVRQRNASFDAASKLVDGARVICNGLIFVLEQSWPGTLGHSGTKQLTAIRLVGPVAAVVVPVTSELQGDALFRVALELIRFARES
jgi:hypothetical protein